ncbi:hypothetical protein QVD17_14206 [Tagetes erecta]|uniref:Uncharacterized protein n=1 Tax=Tagetes erecta TaxID=13708 RepID=A0AAD8L1H2_TARER|nr:hypothetical protein QVD17_14206 [Tagetes erecta]
MMSMAMVTVACSSSSSSSYVFTYSKLSSSHCTYKLTSSYNNNQFSRLSISQIHQHRAHSLQIKCQAAGDDGFVEPQTVYQGVYGPWSVDSTDIHENAVFKFSSTDINAARGTVRR